MKQHLSEQKNNFQQSIILSGNSIAALIIIGATMLFFSCKNDVPKIENSSETLNLPSVTANNYQITYYDSTYIQFRLTTPKLNQYDDKEDPYTEFPQGFKVEKFDRNKNIISSIKGNYGKYFKKDDRYEAFGNVVSVNDKGDTLRTEKLIWDKKEERVFTDQFVQIIQADKVITGIGLESDQEFKNWKILEPKGTIYIDLEE